MLGSKLNVVFLRKSVLVNQFGVFKNLYHSLSLKIGRFVIGPISYFFRLRGNAQPPKIKHIRIVGAALN